MLLSWWLLLFLSFGVPFISRNARKKEEVLSKKEYFCIVLSSQNMYIRFFFLLICAIKAVSLCAQSAISPSSERVGVGTREATETLDVAGTMRLRQPTATVGARIHTRPDGTMSSTLDQPFTPTHSLWVNEQGVLGRKGLSPNFFYLPPMLLPIYPIAVGNNTSYDATTQTFKARVYQEYVQQFSRANGKAVSSTTRLLHQYSASELDFYVTYYDPALFHSVAIDATGVLSYRVHPGVLPTPRSYFSIVVRVK